MAREPRISRELLDGVHEVLGEKSVTSLYQLNFEVKAEKWETRILVLSTWRLYILAAKLPTKIELSLHYLDIQGIESNKPNQLRITTGDGKTYYFTALDADVPDVDAALSNIGVALRTTFPSTPVEKIIKKMDISPAARLKLLTNGETKVDGDDLQPQVAAILDKAASGCDGFSRIYACMCDYHGCTIMDEIVWDLDTIYHCKDLHTLRLQDYDHLSARDHLPLISALQYSDWFSTLDLANTKASSDTLSELLRVLKKTTSLKYLNISNLGLKSDYAQKLSTALLSNVSSTLVSLNLSGNIIDDRGLAHLCGAVAKQLHTMQDLHLAAAGLTVKGVNQLGKALCECSNAGGALQILDLSGNSLKGEELTNLYGFLTQVPQLRELIMADTESPVDSLVAALGKGCMLHLELLDVSRNPFTNKKTKDPSASWESFFQNAQSLKTVLLGSTKLSSAALRALLRGLSANKNTLDVCLDLSSNELRAEGVNVLGGCIAELKNVGSLDISDNELDGNMHEMLPWFGRNKSLRHLSIGKNFSTLKNRQLSSALDSLVWLLQLDDLALRSLSIADSKLRFDTTIIINALGSNTSLEKIDLSGNLFGDVGAKMLAKALTINSHLKTILWDRNGVTVHGLEDVANALERNYFLQAMPMPVVDIAAAAKTQPDKVQTAVDKIQLALQRNHSTVNVSLDYSYRLHQAFLVSSTKNVVEDFIAKPKLSAKRDGVTLDAASLAARMAHQLNPAAKDLTNFCQVMNKLLSVAQQWESKPSGLSSQLAELSRNVQSAVDSQIGVTLMEMVKTVVADYPYLLSNTHDLSVELEAACKESMDNVGEELTSSVIKNHLEVHLATHLRKKNLELATSIADTVIDKILDRLLKQGTKAVPSDAKQQLIDPKSADVKDCVPELTPESADDNFVIVDKPSTQASVDSVATSSNSPPDRALVVNRKSKLCERMRRPQSLVDHLAGSLIVTGPSLELHAVELDIDIDANGSCETAGQAGFVSTTVSSSRTAVHVTGVDSSDGLGLETEAPIDLDSLTFSADSVPQLVHVTKDRPKRIRTHTPVQRRTVAQLESLSPSGGEGSCEEPWNDGVEHFFSQQPVMSASMTASTDVVKAQSSGSKAAALGRSQSTSEADSPQTKKRSFWPFGNSSKDKETKEAKPKEKDDKEVKEIKAKDVKEKEKKSLSNLFGLKKDKKTDTDKVNSEMSDSLFKSTDDVGTSPSQSSGSGNTSGGKPPVVARRPALSVKDIPDKHEAEGKGAAVPEVKAQLFADDIPKPPISVRDIPDPSHSATESSAKGATADAGEEGSISVTRRVIGAAAIPGMGAALAEMKAKKQIMTPQQGGSQTHAVGPKVTLRSPVAPEVKADTRGQRNTGESMLESEGAAKSCSTPPATPPTNVLSPPLLSEKPAVAGVAGKPPAPPKPLPKPKPLSRPVTLDGSPSADVGNDQPDSKSQALDEAASKAPSDEQKKDVSIGDVTKETAAANGSPSSSAAPVPLMRRHKRGDAAPVSERGSSEDAADKSRTSTRTSTDHGRDSGSGSVTGVSSQSAVASVAGAAGSTGDSPAVAITTVGRVQSLRRSLLSSVAGNSGEQPATPQSPIGGSAGRLSKHLSLSATSADEPGSSAAPAASGPADE